MPAPALQQAQIGIFSSSMSNDELCDAVIHRLRGEDFKPAQEKYKDYTDNWKERTVYRWVKVQDALMAESGISYVSSKLEAYLNKNTYLSNLGDIEQANHYLRLELMEVIAVIAGNSSNYGIKSANDFNSIISMIKHPITAAIKRAQDEGERNFQSKVSTEKQEIRSETTSVTPAPQQQRRRGLFGLGFAGL
jgi:hypothetical protein